MKVLLIDSDDEVDKQRRKEENEKRRKGERRVGSLATLAMSGRDGGRGRGWI